MLPWGQFLKAATICGAAGPVSPTGTGGLPDAGFGWCGVWRVSSVRAITIPAAARQAAPTPRYKERRDDNLPSKVPGERLSRECRGATIVCIAMATYRELLKQVKDRIE